MGLTEENKTVMLAEITTLEKESQSGRREEEQE